MAKTVLDYNASVITPITNGINLPVPISPAGLGIATTSVFIDPAIPGAVNNRVELKASIGLRFVGTGNIRVLVRIWRAGKEIYYGLESNVFDNNIILNVETVDVAPLGVQNYQLIIENQTPATTAFVSGPLVFSATAYSG
ncbi:hypothetical protein G9G54_13195 [Paenibacillus sp. EKM212P]|uniref:hypothetical protein n=1 Tax=Paenibacillus sp. EKM212P TaxID=1683680 RepID=UPI0013EB32A0|nr:hypothetical protein [Paenibacillus sp. EKM212P]KAF6578230.1 hypothetical protein G9G54_13195 [Paenibacillus sp. EKM212P]